MLGNKKSVISVSGKTTLLSRDTEISGDVRFSGVLEIEGVVRGNIIAQPGKDSLVRVVEKGRVEGEIRAPSVIINGAVEGNVYSSRHLELAAKARVQGNVFYVMAEMAAGAEVNGSMAHVAEADVDKVKKADTEAPGAGAGRKPAGVAAISSKLD